MTYEEIIEYEKDLMKDNLVTVGFIYPNWDNY